MPRLHKYRNRDACYVLTAIRGAIVTYQLTPEGERKLTAAGIASGQQFHRALLLDLYRTGNAYTGGSGVDDSALAAGQLELDFANDPDPDTAFPACDDCHSVDDLHLTLTGDAAKLTARLECAACRAKASASPDTSIPVSVLTRPLLSRLFELKSVAAKAVNVTRFEELLRTEFESKWAAIRKHLSVSQASLFNPGATDGLNL